MRVAQANLSVKQLADLAGGQTLTIRMPNGEQLQLTCKDAPMMDLILREIFTVHTRDGRGHN